MPRPAPHFELTETALHELLALVNAQKTAQQIVVRASILIGLHQKIPLTHYASTHNLSTRTVRLWRNRWLATSETGLTALERLRDEQRSGCPPIFRPEQWCQIMAIALEHPKESNRSISHWTAREVRNEAVKRGVVSSMGVTTVAEFFKRECFQTT